MNKILRFFITAALFFFITSAVLIFTNKLTKGELRMDKSVSNRNELPLLHFVSIVWRDITENY